MSQLVSSANGGTSGTTVSTSNSGGASGDALNAVTIGTSATCVFDDTQAVAGGLAYKHATSGTSAAVIQEWTGAIGSWSRIYGRIYYRFTSLSLSLDVFRARTAALSAIARVDVAATSGFFRLRNGSNTVVGTSSTALAVNTWYRFEFDFRPGTSVTNTVVLYQGHSTTPLETMAVSSSYSSGTDVGQFHWGNLFGQANVGNRWFDEILIDDTGYPGPVLKTLATAGVG